MLTSADDFAKLWGEYQSRVARLVGCMIRVTSSSSSDLREEAEATAMVALWEASGRYDPGKSDDFWSYASQVVRRCLLDFLRDLDPLSRRARQVVKQDGEDAVASWYLTKPCDLDERASHLASGSDPESLAMEHETKAEIERLLGQLSRRQSDVVRRIALEDEGYATIAADYGVSECRISQVYREALAIMRRVACPCGEILWENACPACGAPRLTEVEKSRVRSVCSSDLFTRGGRTLTLREWATEFGLSKNLVQSRLRRGATLEQALDTSRRPGGGELITVRGQAATAREWAMRRGLSYSTVLARLRRGWGAEQALGTPPRSGVRRLIAGAS